MKWPKWLRRKCKHPWWKLIEEYKRGPWKLDSYWDGSIYNPPSLDIAQWVYGKWKCTRCEAVKICAERFVYDHRWGYAKLMSEPHEL